MRIPMTKFVKKSEVLSSWFEIDAKNAVVGRLATVVSKIIRGKNKNTYTPHMDHGDFVVVKNIEKIKLAVIRMFPGGPLGKKQLTKLKIYSGENHPHSAQNPQTIDLSKLNNKNLIRN